MFCTQCGKKGAESAKFCHSCGAALPVAPAALDDHLDIQVPIDDVTQAHPNTAAPSASYEAPRAAPLPEPAPVAPAYASTEPTAYADFEEAEAPMWKRPSSIVMGLGLLLGFIIWGTRDLWLGPSSAPTKAVAEQPKDSPPPEPGETAIYYALRTAKLRDKPTTQGSQVLGELKRGQRIEGMMETAADGKTQWFKIVGSGHYVAGINLSDQQPADLQVAINRTITLDEQTEIRAAASDSATTVDTVSSGARVDAVGVTNGWIEIGLRKGGVGYIRPSDASANFGLLSGQDVAIAAKPSATDFSQLIAIDPNSCSFGGAMNRIFDAMAANGGEGPLTAAGLPPAQAVTKSGDAIILPTSGGYRGLKVTGLIVTGYGRGIRFADDQEKVATAFTDAGFKKDDNGNYVIQENGGGFSIIAEGGGSQLTCGG
jgi:hypothetical protein